MSAADAVGVLASENSISWKRDRADEGRILESREDRVLDRDRSVLRFLCIP
jgi:hypothetical protein